MDWEKEYKQKLVSVENAAAVIKSNDRICSTTVASIPTDLLIAIGKRYKELENVTIISQIAMYPFDFFKHEYSGHIKYHVMFMGALERQYYPEGNIDITSYNFSRSDWMVRNRMKANVFVSEVSPPDENGNMSFGPLGAMFGKIASEYADTVIVQVNKKTPYVYGSEKAFISVKEVDYICESERDLAELSQPPLAEEETKIASHIIPYIEDGSTIQIGLGGVANAVGFFLEGHKDLGVHTEMLTDSLVNLAEKGVINGSKKSIHQGEMVIAFGLGSKKLYAFMHKNEMVKAYPVSYVNDPNIIGKNRKFVSINSCLACDLTGQVGSESIGFNQFSCTGGQLDFVRGASLSEDGKSFLCMNSTAKKKDGSVVSKITVSLPPGTVVTTPRTDVHYVVTEYGVADLRERSIGERVKAMINIAHPNFRDRLGKEAKENGVIY